LIAAVEVDFLNKSRVYETLGLLRDVKEHVLTFGHVVNSAYIREFSKVDQLFGLLQIELRLFLAKLGLLHGNKEVGSLKIGCFVCPQRSFLTLANFLFFCGLALQLDTHNLAICSRSEDF